MELVREAEQSTYLYILYLMSQGIGWVVTTVIYMCVSVNTVKCICESIYVRILIRGFESIYVRILIRGFESIYVRILIRGFESIYVRILISTWFESIYVCMFFLGWLRGGISPPLKMFLPPPP